MVLTLEVVEFEWWPMVLLASSQCLHSMALVQTLCLSLQSIAQSIEKAHDPASIHSLPQLLVVSTHQPVSLLFAMSFCLAFVLLPAFASLFFLSSSTLVLPSPSSLSPSASVLLPTTSSFLSSFALFSSFVAPYLLLLPKFSPSRFSTTSLFPLSCTILLPSIVVVVVSSRAATILKEKPSNFLLYWLLHGVWRNYKSNSKCPPLANDMPHGSMENKLSHSGPLKYHGDHTD